MEGFCVSGPGARTGPGSWDSRHTGARAGRGSECKFVGPGLLGPLLPTSLHFCRGFRWMIEGSIGLQRPWNTAEAESSLSSSILHAESGKQVSKPQLGDTQLRLQGHCVPVGMRLAVASAGAALS